MFGKTTTLAGSEQARMYATSSGLSGKFFTYSCTTCGALGGYLGGGFEGVVYGVLLAYFVVKTAGATVRAVL